MNKESNEDIAIKLSMWWMEAINKPMNQDNGDKTPAGAMSYMLMNMLAGSIQDELTPEILDNFQKSLEKKILGILNTGGYLNLSVDYQPSQTLSEVAIECGIGLGCFPCKSSSYINQSGQAVVSMGYQSKQIIL